jgi:5-methylcytosine-specific restriction endonuclease McrA
LDHIVPLSRGGTHEPSNVQLAHYGCNSKRGAKGPAQMRLAAVS